MPKAQNALYDRQFGWNPPARFQQERAWCEVVRKEKHIQGVHEKNNREHELHGSKRGRKWPGGPACGTDSSAAPCAPYFEDSDISHKYSPLTKKTKT